jgi:hypothetical protein
MDNVWLGRRQRRVVRRTVLAYVAKFCHGVPANLNDEYIDKCTDYAVEMVGRVGYVRAMAEMEGIIKTIATIDSDRFCRR